VVVGKSVPQALKITFTTGPFTVVTNLGTYTPTLTETPSQNTPFDFLISCETQTFKLYVNGEIVASTLSNFHTVQDRSGKFYMPNVVNIAFTSQGTSLSKFSYTYSELCLTFKDVQIL